MDSSKLETLFDLLCDDFTKLLSQEDPMTAADRKLLLEFLENNQVNCVGMNSKKVSNIVEKLPFDDEGHALTIINQ